MPYTNRYSSYHDQNDYKSYSYTTQPQQLQQQQQRSVSWRPPRYIPSSYLTSSSSSQTATATPIPPHSQTKKEEDLQEEEDSSNILTLATQITDELQAEVDYNMHEVGIVIYLPSPHLFLLLLLLPY